MQHLTDLTHPMVNVDLPASQAQRRLTTHGDAMGALPAMQTPVCNIPHLFRVTAGEHLPYEVVIGTLIVPTMASFAHVPVLGKDLFEDVPGRRGFCSQQAISRWEWWCLYGGVLLSHPACHVHPVLHPHWDTVPHQLPLTPWGREGNPQMKIPRRSRYCWYFLSRT